MKKSVFFFLVLSLHVAVFASEKTNTNSFLFAENKGQVIDQNHAQRNDVLFYGNSKGLGFFITKQGVSYQLYQSSGRTNDSSHSVTIQRVDISWPGANENPQVTTEHAGTATDNYYTLETPVLGVKSYEQVRLQNLYKDIDLKYYQQEGGLKYDYIVHPHADYHAIQLQFDGAALTLEKDGTVTIKTPLGTITEGQPIAYQNGQPVAVHWIMNNNILSFQIPDYNAEEELVIDPLVYVWTILADPYHNNYTIINDGLILNDTMIVSAINDYMYNDYNCSVMKYGISGYNSQRNYIGMNNINNPYQTVINNVSKDAIGNVYYSGSTSSSFYIATTGAYQTTFQGWLSCFLRKIVIDTISTAWSTYYGGYGSQSATIASYVKDGGVYIAGYTSSATGMSSIGSFQPNYGGNTDAFLAKFDTNGHRVWGTYFGGSDYDKINRICLDTIANSLYVCGVTKSVSGIATANTFQSNNIATANCSAFVARFDTSGNRIWGSYFGADSTNAVGITTNNKGAIYFTGLTNCTAGIATNGTSQQSPMSTWDGYLERFDSTGQRIWGTYYGGSNNDFPTGCTLDTSSHVFVSGTTYSTDNIATYGAMQTSIPGTDQSAMLMEFDTLGIKRWGTYCLSGIYTTGENCFSDPNGNIYLCGVGYYKVTSMLYEYSCYLTKFSQFTAPTPTISAYPYAICTGKSVVISTSNVTNGLYQWYHNNIPMQSANTNQITVDSIGDYYVQVTVNSSSKNSSTITLNNATPPTTIISSTNISCGGKADGSITILATGGTPPYVYQANGATVTFNAQNYGPGQYSIKTTDNNGCYVLDTVTITQPPILNLSADISNQPCYSNPVGAIQVYVTGGIPPYVYSWANLPDTTSSLAQLSPGYYKITVTDSVQCKASKNLEVQKIVDPMPSVPLASICAVTVDTFEWKNRIYWSKGSTPHASVYKIYRESTIANQYDLVGTVPSNLIATYLDSTSLPLQQSYRYKISEEDSCGNDFMMSDYHQTMHLSANLGINGEVNLAWTLYEGISYNTQYVLRSINNSAFDTIAQVSSAATSFTDANPPAGQKLYQISIAFPAACLSGLSKHISSNYIVLNQNGSTVHVFPNPTSGIIKIRGTIPYHIVVEDISGQSVLEEGKTSEININGLATGMYFIKLFDVGNNCYFRSKIMKK